MSELNQRQRLFVEFYLVNPNATEAAIKAGYSKRTARSQGQRLLTKVDIKELLGKRVEAEIMSANEVLQELALIAKCDWQDFVEVRRDKHGDIIDASLKLSDKIKALELVGKYHKLFTEKTESTIVGQIDINHTGEVAFAKAAAKIYGLNIDQPEVKGYIDGTSSVS